MAFEKIVEAQKKPDTIFQVEHKVPKGCLTTRQAISMTEQEIPATTNLGQNQTFLYQGLLFCLKKNKNLKCKH